MPTLTAASGPISVPQETLRTQLADCATFRSLVGAANQAQALEKVHIGALLGPDSGEAFSFSELTSQRPFAIVYTEPAGGLRRVLDGVGGAYSFKGAGNLVIYFEENLPGQAADSPGEVERLIQNRYGAILSELLALAGQGGYLTIRELVVHGPYRTFLDERETLGDAIAYYFDIEWGQV